MNTPHPNSHEPLITAWFLANGGREGLYRNEFAKAGFHRATVTRWIRRMQDEGKVKREIHGRQSFVRWIEAS